MSEVHVGTITVQAGRKHTQRYETAAWFTDYEIAPGTYKVFAYPYCGSRDGVYWQAGFTAEGTITDEFFSNGFFGHYTPCKDNGKNVGTVRRAHFPARVDEIEFLPGFEAGVLGYIVKEGGPAWARKGS